MNCLQVYDIFLLSMQRLALIIKSKETTKKCNL